MSLKFLTARAKNRTCYGAVTISFALSGRLLFDFLYGQVLHELRELIDRPE